jgi:RNAse (barnase) inhibitor barstar
MKKRFIIDGNKFSDLNGFYDEVQKVLTDNFEGFGRNLDAFNDILRGGFGKFDDENITIIWKHSKKSKRELKDFDTLVEIIESHKEIELILD